MKRICTITMMLLVTGLVKAQQINNGGFESWDSKGDYTEPTGWYTLNALVEFGFDPTATQTGDAHGGTSAVMLESKSSPFSDLSGVLCTGPILDAQFEPDFSNMKVPFTGAPTKFEFYYKSDPEPGDTCLIFMCLTRWNVALQKTDTVATATKLFGDSVGVYTKASIDFEYETPLPADSMFIIATSSADGFNPTVGSVLILDDLSLVYGSSGIVKTKEVIFPVTVFPNPASGLINIDSKRTIREVVLTDYSGKTVYDSTVNTTQLDVSDLATGVYFLTVSDENNNRSTKKISIQH